MGVVDSFVAENESLDESWSRAYSQSADAFASPWSKKLSELSPNLVFESPTEFLLRIPRGRLFPPITVLLPPIIAMFPGKVSANLDA
jgi:hypothetical protein